MLANWIHTLSSGDDSTPSITNGMSFVCHTSVESAGEPDQISKTRMIREVFFEACAALCFCAVPDALKT